MSDISSAVPAAVSAPRTRGKPVLAGALAFAALLAAFAIFTTLVGARVRAQDPAPTAPPLPVAVVSVELADGATFAEAFPGLVSARRDSRLGFETGGRLAEVSVDVGARVAAGDRLASLDLRSLDAQILAARAQAAEATAAADLARVTAERQRELVARGHVSDQRLDEADANVRAAEARLAAAEAQIASLRVRRDLAILTAPFAGVITERFLDEGAIAAPGAPVVQLVEDGALEIRVGLPESQAGRLQPGAAYDFALDGRTVSAVARAETGVLDRATRTVTAIFDLEPGAEIAPGAIARLQLDTTRDAAGAWLPMTALAQGRRGLWSVFVLEPNGERDVFTLEKRVVEVVHTEADRAYVRGAVANGERVVASGVDRIVPGQRVTPTTAAQIAVN